jgi:outer membrane murein-binding lipoprotein Lpp
MPSVDPAAEVQKQLAAERERLGTAVQDLRTEVDSLKRKLPYVAAAAVAAGVLVHVARRRLGGG